MVCQAQCKMLPALIPEVIIKITTVQFVNCNQIAWGWKGKIAPVISISFHLLYLNLVHNYFSPLACYLHSVLINSCVFVTVMVSYILHVNPFCDLKHASYVDNPPTILEIFSIQAMRNSLASPTQ